MRDKDDVLVCDYCGAKKDGSIQISSTSLKEGNRDFCQDCWRMARNGFEVLMEVKKVRTMILDLCAPIATVASASVAPVTCQEAGTRE